MAAAKKKLRCLRGFHDIKDGIDRKAGEVFECSATRMNEILAAYPSNPLVEPADGQHEEAEAEPTEAA